MFTLLLHYGNMNICQIKTMQVYAMTESISMLHLNHNEKDCLVEAELSKNGALIAFRFVVCAVTAST